MFTAFSAGETPWRVSSQRTVRGQALPAIAGLSVHSTIDFPQRLDSSADWPLVGRASHVRYVEKAEKDRLVSVQAGLGRADATCAALIPIRKSDAWWMLTQDERRNVFEAQSHHIADSLKYLPAIAHQLYHSRDLGQPFDFLTWFEFAPEHASAFDDLVCTLRETPEWSYVEREIDLRLFRSSA